METAIILQGFKEAKSKYGLTYTTFIGDGDQGFIQDFRFGGETQHLGVQTTC